MESELNILNWLIVELIAEKKKLELRFRWLNLGKIFVYYLFFNNLHEQKSVFSTLKIC